jgi:pimeloyl-ACP methyl ester carboxylesterase
MLQNKPYNFIFIDSRGHGKSDGELLTYEGIKHYGESQYLDIVATVEFIINYNKKNNITSDIILHGLCSGAFHTIKAVDYLKKFNQDAYNSIKGIIFDSGWPAISDIAETVVNAEAGKHCKSYNISYLQPYISYLMVGIYRFLFKKEHSKQTSIADAISSIEQPILFIHAENDIFTPIHHIYPLVAITKKPTTWFVKNSSHVNNHLKHKDKYAYKLQKFIRHSILKEIKLMS